MKRKHGSKAGYKKGKNKVNLTINDSAPTPTHTDTEDVQELDEANDLQLYSNANVESPYSESDKPIRFAPSIVGSSTTGKSGHGRVKVKIKSSRPLETSYSHSDVRLVTNKGNTKVRLPMHGMVMENREDAYSDRLTSDIPTPSSGKSSRKSGSIKIISSRGLGCSTTSIQDVHYHSHERVLNPSDNERTIESDASMKFYQQETRSPLLESRYNDKELKTSLSVIKEVMKMDAAEPFNTPVDPVALGIPDYFDVIDTPMDFGTICDNLEHGRKYLNSEDVLKDVEFIWDNCYKYNNKGDYIIDLMKRVKKNFLKHWTAACLFSGNSSGGNATLHAQNSVQEKPYSKGKLPKYKRKGMKQHKSGCLCAVCIMKRRRKEREGKLTGNEIETTNLDMHHDIKEEESSPIDNLENERSPSSLGQSVASSPQLNIDESEQNEVEIVKHDNAGQAENDSEMELLIDNDSNTHSNLMVVDDVLLDYSSQKSQGQEIDSSNTLQISGHNDYMQGQDRKEEKQTEQSEMQTQISLYENAARQENHLFFEICQTLFPKPKRSTWNQYHSLSWWNNFPSAAAKDNPMHAAVAKLLKQ